MKLPRIRILLLFLLILPLIAGAVTQEDVVGFWRFNLEPGFNLVTFPILPDNPTIQNVIGGNLGTAEISTWDKRMNRFRAAIYDPQTNRWTGDLYVLNRGIGYWINVRDEESKTLIVTGKPEKYVPFKWSQLGHGWSFFAPTYGSVKEINEYSPTSSDNLVLRWNTETDRFEMAEASGNEWSSPEFQEIAPDEAYIAYVDYREAQLIGPRTTVETSYIPDDGSDPNGGNYTTPPWPLIIGNNIGLPVCNPDGGFCSGGFVVHVIRESGEINPHGDFNLNEEIIQEQIVPVGSADQGRFKMALTISNEDGFLNPGDRVYLQVRGANGGTTRSNSFEIPAGERFLNDIDFPSPMTAGDELALAPEEFKLSAPYPNPFNSRFRIEVSLPNAAPVEYSLYDVQGRKVMGNITPMSAGVHRMTISPEGISAGIYLLKVNNGVQSDLAKVAFIK